jgi:hypothetical protein
MIHTNDPTPRPRSALDFPPGTTPEEKADRWTHLIRHPEELPEEVLDAALFEMMDSSRRAT